MLKWKLKRPRFSNTIVNELILLNPVHMYLYYLSYNNQILLSIHNVF